MLAEAEALAASPLPDSVAVISLAAALAARAEGRSLLPAGAVRLALAVDGTEPDADVEAAGGLDATLVLLRVAPGVSRVHASRRVFEALTRARCHLPVVHALEFAPGTGREELVLSAGALVGALMVDGRGDGVMLSAPGQDLAYLRTTSFGLLQVREGWFRE